MLVYRGGVRAPVALICQYIEAKKEEFGVEPICATLSEAGVQIAPSTYYARRSRPPRSGLLGVFRTLLVLCFRPPCSSQGVRVPPR